MGLEIKNLSFAYVNKIPILKELNIQIAAQERVVLVGPSGYGKSTLVKLVAGFQKPQSGEILWKGAPLTTQGYNPLQLIYQHPEKAINPRWKMKQVLSEGWQPPQELLEEFGIRPEWLERWPAELSGGELQRFCIVRALGPQTEFLIADEISTMLDVITQAQIWRAVLNILKKRKIGLLAVTHNMELAKQIGERIIYLPEINQIKQPKY